RVPALSRGARVWSESHRPVRLQVRVHGGTKARETSSGRGWQHLGRGASSWSSKRRGLDHFQRPLTELRTAVSSRPALGSRLKPQVLRFGELRNTQRRRLCNESQRCHRGNSRRLL